jgi:hypothetical protein
LVSRFASGAILFVASLGLAGCTPAPFVSPAQGGPSWTKLTTSHFTVYTDMPVDEASDVARDLQESYGALQDLAFPYAKACSIMIRRLNRVIEGFPTKPPPAQGQRGSEPKRASTSDPR